MEEQLITKLLQILGKEKITIKGNVLSISGKEIKLSSKGGQKTNTRIRQLR